MAGIGIGLASPFFYLFGSQGGGGGQPPDFIQTDSALWLLASEGVTLNGSTVSAWADQSTHGNDVSQGSAARQPVFVGSSINGQPALALGIDTHMPAANFTQGNLAEHETFAVFRTPSDPIATDFPFVIVGRNPSNRGDISFNGSGNMSTFAGNSATIPTDAPLNEVGIARQLATATEHTAQWLSASFDESITVGPATQEMGACEIGALAGLNNRTVPVDLAEVIIFPRELSETERAEIMTYLGNKYNIPVPDYVIPVQANGTNYLTADDGASPFVRDRTLPMSLVLWAKAPTSNTAAYLATAYSSAQVDGWAVDFQTNGRFRAQFTELGSTDGLRVDTPSGSITSGGTHCVGFTKQSGGCRASDVELFIDGAQQAKTVGFDTFLSGTWVDPAGNPFNLLGRSDGTAIAAEGAIYQAAVFDVELTAQQMTDIYDAGASGDIQSLSGLPAPIGYFRADGPDFSDLVDLGTSGTDLVVRPPLT